MVMEEPQEECTEQEASQPPVPPAETAGQLTPPKTTKNKRIFCFCLNIFNMKEKGENHIDDDDGK